MWFLFALVCLLGWGFADLFYKKGTNEYDKNSHLKISVFVGLIMGICSIILLVFGNSSLSLDTLFSNGIKYLPASLSYIVSMIIGYAGLRYLALSIISPVQNASGALSAIVILIYFIITGKTENFFTEFSILDILGTLLIILGVILLAVIENKLSKDEKANLGENKKYRYGALALLFPILYCVFDTIGTAADGIILNRNSSLNLNEIDILILYGLTFLIVGIIAYIIISIKEKKPYNIFSKSETPKLFAACCEEFGQIFYVFAMAKNPVLAAPMIASYCIVSVILSRCVLKEKLTNKQYISVILVILGIVLLGVSEGITS